MNENCYFKNSCKKYKNQSCDENFCLKLFKINKLLDASLLSEKQKNHKALYIDSDGTDEEAFRRLKTIENEILAFVSRGDNLYLHSKNTGNGKTEWSIRLLQAYNYKIWHSSNMECETLFINIPRFLLTLKDSISNQSDYIDHIKANVLTAKLVVWDEIGSSILTQYEHQNLLNLINTRIDSGLSNIYTSNLSGEELLKSVGDRLYSRIVNSSIDIELFGMDKRRLSI